MFAKSVPLLSFLAAISIAAPVADPNPSPLTKRDTVIPDKVKAPAPGQCGILVYSPMVLPIGGIPTGVGGQPLGDSQADTGPTANVINHKKEVIGAKGLTPTNPHFKADIPLEGGKGTFHLTVAGITDDSSNWGLAWTYKGKDGQGTGNPACEQYGMTDHVFVTYNIHSCYFAC